ncbi:MAG: cupin domain-containing protein [Solirubrobacteraceae bacterium]
MFEPGQRSRIHRHERQEEVYLPLRGELTLILEGTDEHVLGAGDLVRVGPDVRRQLLNRGSDRLELLALGGSGEHEGRDGRAYAAWDEEGAGRSPAEVPFPADEAI